MAKDVQYFNVHVQSYPLALRDAHADTEAASFQGRFTLSPSTSREGRLAVPLSDINSRLLKRTIHKGKPLGLSLRLPADSPVHAFDDLPANAPQQSYWVVLEHMDDSNAGLDQHVITTSMSLTPEQKNSLNTRMIRDVAYNSDHIEGSGVRWRDCLRFDIARQPPEGASQDDVEFRFHCQSIRDLVLPMALRDVRSITEDYIKALHASLRLVDLAAADRGQYKRQQNYPGSREIEDEDEYYTPPARVETDMRAMLTELYQRDSNEPLEVAVWLHQQFVQIHPFIDGNGRTGRLLMNAYLLQQGLPLSCIEPEVRFVYYASLHSAHELQSNPNERLPPLALLHRMISESVLLTGFE